MVETYLGLGTNLGNKEENIRLAIEKLGELVGPVVRQSALYASEPWGFESANSFLNAAVCCLTRLSPLALLEATQQIERAMGRRKDASLMSAAQVGEGGGATAKREYHDRIIDIDILLYGDLTIRHPHLVVPHPLMHERDFVMQPLREIAKNIP